MAYSPAPLALDRTKPGPWNVEGAFVDAAHIEFWLRLYAAIPFWDPSGEPSEIVRRNLTQRVNDPAWVVTPYGAGLSFNGSSQYLNVGLQGLGSNIETSVSTFVVRIDSSAQGVLAGVFNDGTNLGYQIWVNTDELEASSAGKVYGFLRSDSDVDSSGMRGATTNSVGINDGDVHIVSVVTDKGGGLFTIIVDGLERPVTMDATSTDTNPTAFEYDLTVGARNLRGTTDNHYTGEVIFAAWHDRLIPAPRIERWHHDIWGLLRPNWDYVTATGFDPANLQATVDGSDVTLTWDV